MSADLCEEKGCFRCMYNYGAVKHYCHKRGGDATFEFSGGSEKFTAPGGKEFRKYRLENGPMRRIKDHPNYTVENGIKGVYIESQKQEREIMDKMGVRFGETGETLAGGDGTTSAVKIGDKPDKPMHIRR